MEMVLLIVAFALGLWVGRSWGFAVATRDILKTIAKATAARAPSVPRNEPPP